MGDIDKQEQGMAKNKQKAIAEILAQSSPKTIEGQPVTTETMPAYTPDQMDRFGSPMPNVQRQPEVNTTTPTRTETPEEIQARLRPLIYQAVGQYGNDPSLQLALNDLNYQRERGARKEDITDQRGYEEKLYNRGREDKLSDTEAERKYQDIVRKEQQGFQVSQQDRQFKQQFQLQAQNQGFQASQQAKSQQFQAGQNELTRKQQLDIEKAKTGGTNGLPKLTEDQGKAMGWLSQANNAYKNMNNVIYKKDKEGNPILNNGQPVINYDVAQPSTIEAGLSNIGLEGTANMLRSAPRQQFLQATSSMGEAILRAATGAGVTRDEAIQKQRELTPQFTDKPEVIQQKLNAIPVYLESLKARAGAGAGLVPNLNTQPPTSGAKFLGFE